jgi:ribonuclease BN (tRNA processing enzyme)
LILQTLSLNHVAEKARLRSEKRADVWFMNSFFRRFFLVLLCVITSHVASAGSADHTLDIYWNDVEGGGATLIVTPSGESVLIDSGNPGGRDAGRIHKTAKEVAGLKKIDHYVTTHFHRDHYGGAAELAALMPIGQVYDNGITDTDPDHNLRNTNWPAQIKPYREFKADGRNILQPGDAIALKQPANGLKLTLRCVGAKQKFFQGRQMLKQTRSAAQARRSPLTRPTTPTASYWCWIMGHSVFLTAVI